VALTWGRAPLTYQLLRPRASLTGTEGSSHPPHPPQHLPVAPQRREHQRDKFAPALPSDGPTTSRSMAVPPVAAEGEEGLKEQPRGSAAAAKSPSPPGSDAATPRYLPATSGEALPSVLSGRFVVAAAAAEWNSPR
jgi:hypothetical protein